MATRARIHQPYKRQRPKSSSDEVARIHASARWRRVSLLKRAQDPLCEDCKARGLTVEATSVHHIEPLSRAPERAFDMDNLAALCHACHRRRELAHA